MLRIFCGTEDTSLKSKLTKVKRLPRQTLENEPRLAETDLTINIPKGKGIEPLLLTGPRTLYTRPSVTLRFSS
jgi:hypothetical protein